MITENGITTKIAGAPIALTLGGNQVITLAAIAAVGVCVAMLFNYRIEFSGNGLVVIPSKSNSDAKALV